MLPDILWFHCARCDRPIRVDFDPSPSAEFLCDMCQIITEIGDVSSQPWASHARCGDSDDPDLWFDQSTRQQAKKECARCLVRDKCAQWAIDNKVYWGIWGGLTPLQRGAPRTNWPISRRPTST